jgi:uncharacterized protein
MMKKMAVSAGKIAMLIVSSALMIVGYIEMAAPAMGMKPGPGAGTAATIVFEAVQLLSMLIPATLMMWSMNGKSPYAMGLSPRGMGTDTLAGWIVGGFIFLVGLAVAFAAGWARLDLQLQNFSLLALGAGALTMGLHAAMEEVMMRGFVLQEMMSKFSTAASVIASSLLFVALHAGALVTDEVGLVGAANIFLASLLMSVAYLRTRQLWLPIGIHAGWNFTQGPLLGINVSGNDFSEGWSTIAFQGSKWVTGGEFGFEASLPGLVGPALGIAMILLFVRPKT